MTPLTREEVLKLGNLVSREAYLELLDERDELRGVVEACRENGNTIEPREGGGGWAVNNVRALKAEAEADDCIQLNGVQAAQLVALVERDELSGKAGELRAALKRVLPYAESRAEDMLEVTAALGAEADEPQGDMPSSRALSDAAWAAVSDAEAALATTSAATWLEAKLSEARREQAQTDHEGMLDVLNDEMEMPLPKDVEKALNQRLDMEHSRATAAALEAIEGKRGYEPFAEALAERDARVRAAALEEAATLVLDGSFLHDQAPTAQFAREVAAMLRRHVALAAKGTDGDGPRAPPGGCEVECPACTRVGRFRVEAGQPIGFCAQCSLGEGRKVRLVVAPRTGLLEGPEGGA
jgi:hypothetical protein